MSYNSDEHSFTFRFHSAEGERDLEMNCNALYVDDILSFMRDFLQGCGYQIEGTIEVVPYETYEEETPKQDKFSMDHLPNNGWPFGLGQPVQSLTTADIQPLTTAQIKPLSVHDIPLSASPAGMAASWSAELPSSTGSKIRVQF
jgi:hypothetical protein